MLALLLTLIILDRGVRGTGEDGSRFRAVEDNDHISITIQGEEWFRNTDVVYHQDGQEISLSKGNLKLNSSNCCSIGEDLLGSYVMLEQSWTHEEMVFLTSVRTYQDTIVFTQHFPHGLSNVSLDVPDAHNLVSTAFPCLQGPSRAYLSYGGTDRYPY